MATSGVPGKKILRSKSGLLIKHGTANAYSNHGCRCQRCRKEWSRYMLTRMREIGVKPLDEYNRERRENVRHGTQTMYSSYGCRCEKCRAGSARRRQQVRLKAYARPVPENLHGTLNAYTNYGCRCDRCREATRTHARKRRQERS